jgi:chromate transporter
MDDTAETVAPARSHVRQPRGIVEIFLVFLRLGLTSFGGPIAHLGYFRAEIVHRRKWLDDESYADLVALCQFTPGAASSKVGMGLGLSAGGLPGAVAAWLGFTLPSALAMVLFAYGVAEFGDLLNAGFLHGLKVVAVAVVALAVWGMARNLCPDAPRATLAVGAALLASLWPTSLGQISAITAGALVGLTILGDTRRVTGGFMPVRVSRLTGTVAFALFFGLLAGLPALSAVYPVQALALFDSFYRAGSLVFGGGHVVLPLLQSADGGRRAPSPGGQFHRVAGTGRRDRPRPSSTDSASERSADHPGRPYWVKVRAGWDRAVKPPDPPH